MPVRSMTGFGRAQRRGKEHAVVVEVRSLNHRFLDISVQLPREIPQTWEMKVRDMARKRVRRGRIDVYVALEAVSGAGVRPRIDRALAQQYYDFLKELGQTHDLAFDVSMCDLITLPGVIELEEDVPEPRDIEEMFNEAVRGALDQVVEMRVTEGAEIQERLHELSARFTSRLTRLEEAAPDVGRKRYQAVVDKVRSLLLEEVSSIEDLDIQGEVALAVQRTSIQEELDRLRSHLNQFNSALIDSDGGGRRIEFVVSEMLRETNTVAAKIADAQLNEAAIEMKSILEDVREQVRNIE